MDTTRHTRHTGFNPADYLLVAEIDRGTEDEPGYTYWAVKADHAARALPLPDSLRCDHCGKPESQIRYSALFLHTPSDTLVWFGHICATDAGLPDLDSLFVKRAREEAQRRAIKIRAWLYAEEHADAFRFLFAHQDDDFGQSLASGWLRYGDLSERQLAALDRWMTRDAERKAQRATAAVAMGPFPTGRVTVEGIVRSVRFDDSDFGSTAKMLVELADGNRVWSTAPQSLFGGRWQGSEWIVENGKVTALEDLRGCTVRFTATLEVSQKDEHFGFAKRPTKAQVTQYPVATVASAS